MLRLLPLNLQLLSLMKMLQSRDNSVCSNLGSITRLVCFKICKHYGVSGERGLFILPITLAGQENFFGLSSS